MKNIIKKKLIAYLIFIVILSIFACIYALLISSEKTSTDIKAFNTITFVFGIVAFLILGFLSGKVAGRNGLIEGLISGLVIIIICLIANLFIQIKFEPMNFVKIICYLISSCLGGVLGVNTIKGSKVVNV